MKSRILALAVLCAPVLESSEPIAERPVPKPRPRLYMYQPPPTPEADAEQTQGEPGVVTMEKVEVTESRVGDIPTTVEKPAPKKFTPLGGGRIFSTKIGSLPVDVGVWLKEDILAADARFKPQSTRVDLDLIRIRF